MPPPSLSPERGFLQRRGERRGCLLLQATFRVWETELDWGNRDSSTVLVPYFLPPSLLK